MLGGILTPSDDHYFLAYLPLAVRVTLCGLRLDVLDGSLQLMTPSAYLRVRRRALDDLPRRACSLSLLLKISTDL